MPTPGYSVLAASDIVGDHKGNLYISSVSLKFYAKADRGPLMQQGTSMQAGKIYTVAGGGASSETFLASYTPTELTSVDPTIAPPLVVVQLVQ